MQLFIRKPSIDMFTGVRVDKDTKLEYKTEQVEQTVENLVLHSVTKLNGEGFESTLTTTIQLEEGDVLIYENEGRGYIKPVESFVTVAEAMEELACIKDMG
jgi:hypothetical protein